jgi:hypothetical protein
MTLLVIRVGVCVGLTLRFDIAFGVTAAGVIVGYLFPLLWWGTGLHLVHLACQ